MNHSQGSTAFFCMEKITHFLVSSFPDNYASAIGWGGAEDGISPLFIHPPHSLFYAITCKLAQTFIKENKLVSL